MYYRKYEYDIFELASIPLVSISKYHKDFYYLEKPSKLDAYDSFFLNLSRQLINFPLLSLTLSLKI